MSLFSLSVHIENKNLIQGLKFICNENIDIIKNEDNEIQIVDDEGFTAYKPESIILKDFNNTKSINVNFQVGIRCFCVNFSKIPNGISMFIFLDSVDEIDVEQIKNMLIQSFFKKRYVLSMFGIKKDYSFEVEDWDRIIFEGGRIDIEHFSLLGIKSPFFKYHIINLSKKYVIDLEDSYLFISENT